MHTRAFVLFGLCVSTAAVPALAASPAIESVYTDISGDECTQVAFDEEHGSSHLRCPGVAGYHLDLHDSDNRMSLDVVTPAGKSHPLEYWQTITWGFSHLGDKAEWRLEAGKPIAVIARVNASENPEDASKITSYLAVAKITPDTICVIAKIAPSARANEEARNAADRAASQPCLSPPE